MRRLAGAILLLLLFPLHALAHGALRGATPGDGDHLSVAPRELRLRFNEAIELPFARLALVGPDGAEVALGALLSPPDSARVIVAPITGRLAAGAFLVRWQVAGADGHPVRGEFHFVIAPGAQGLEPDPPAGAAPPVPVQHHDPVSLPTGSGFDAGSPLYVLVRWLTFVGLLCVVGAAAFRLLVLPLAARRGAPLTEAAGRRAAGVGLAFAGVLAVAALLRLLAQSYALHGAEQALSPDLLASTLTRTVWGWGWLLQAVGTAVALAGFALARRGGAGWGMAAAGTLLLAFVPALSGHAAASPSLTPVAVLADGLHVLGAGGWMGSLLLIVAVGIPAAMRLSDGERGRAVAALVEAFSPTALVFAGVVVATGVFSAWLHMPSLAALWESAYGRTLLIKLAVLSGVFGAGAYNWLRVRPALVSDAGTERLRRSATVELAVGVLVLVVTAVLVATATPGEAEMVAGR